MVINRPHLSPLIDLIDFCVVLFKCVYFVILRCRLQAHCSCSVSCRGHPTAHRHHRSYCHLLQVRPPVSINDLLFLIDYETKSSNMSFVCRK